MKTLHDVFKQKFLVDNYKVDDVVITFDYDGEVQVAYLSRVTALMLNRWCNFLLIFKN